MDREGEVDSIKPPPPVPQSPIQVSLPPLIIMHLYAHIELEMEGRGEGEGKLNKRRDSIKPPSLPRMEGVCPTMGIYSPDSTAKSCTVQEYLVRYGFFKDTLGEG